eukprot:356449_1
MHSFGYKYEEKHTQLICRRRKEKFAFIYIYLYMCDKMTLIRFIVYKFALNASTFADEIINFLSDISMTRLSIYPLLCLDHHFKQLSFRYFAAIARSIPSSCIIINKQR